MWPPCQCLSLGHYFLSDSLTYNQNLIHSSTPQTSEARLYFGQMSFGHNYFVTRIQNVRVANNWIQDVQKYLVIVFHEKDNLFLPQEVPVTALLTGYQFCLKQLRTNYQVFTKSIKLQKCYFSIPLLFNVTKKENVLPLSQNQLSDLASLHIGFLVSSLGSEGVMPEQVIIHFFKIHRLYICIIVFA